MDKLTDYNKVQKRLFVDRSRTPLKDMCVFHPSKIEQKGVDVWRMAFHEGDPNGPSSGHSYAP